MTATVSHGRAVDVPWAPVRVFNSVAGRVPRLSPGLPGSEELVRRALAQVPGARAEDLGDDSWRPGLDALLAALRSEAELTPLGRRFAVGALVTHLVTRMQVHRALAADPAITRRPVGPAVVVVGLPRSGTTLLQHLLALDPDHRSLLQWEAVQPAPPPGADPEADRRRIQAAEHSTRLGDRLAPYARVLHPTGPLLPAECVTLFAHSFASLETAVLYHVPSYTRWCLEADMRPHYAFYAQQLQVLARHQQRPRWALKSPAHLFWLPELLQALPEARVVVLRRDPLEALGSFCRLVTVLSAVTSSRSRPAEVGTLWSRVWAEGVRRAAVARATLPRDRVVDVEYRDLVADPVRTVAGLYESLGHPFGDDLARRIRAHVAAHPQRSTGLPSALPDFGLSPAVERLRFVAAAAGAGGAPPGVPLPRDGRRRPADDEEGRR